MAEDRSTADYIVVGGGLTGCVIASRLQQSQHQTKEQAKVILVEAGPDPSTHPAVAGFLSGLSLQGGELDYAYQSEPVATTAGRVHTLNAGRALGGGSILNYGGWLRADAADYDEWAQVVGDKRWGYEGLGPWMRKSEFFHGDGSGAEDSGGRGTDGPMHVTTVSGSESGERKYPLRDAVRDAWASLGVSQNVARNKEDGSIAGLVEMSENSRGGQRQPSYTAYPLDGVHVLTNTLVQKVIFSGTTATGVELADGRRLTARKEVILCAGAYRTPQLLMLSGIGPPEAMAEHGIPVVKISPQVGSNLHDHFAVYLAFRLRDPDLGYAMGSPAWQEIPALFKGLPWDWVVSQPLPDTILSRHEHSATGKSHAGRNLYEVLTLYVPPGIPGIPMDGTHIATSTMLLLPTSRGSVTIRSTDIQDPPLIRPNYLSTPLDQATLVHAVRQTLEAVLATEGLGPIVEGETPPSSSSGRGLAPLTARSTDGEIQDRIRSTGTQHHHSGGTAAMGAVVDAEARVIGVHGLRVADASVVPVPLGGHPQATLYAMAEQIAAMIIEAL
ncbi:hypothetical protein DHEL01_v204909 [Diaporthe helianthi]|uniref:Glucose-methanol-choline oxidoreductase N-terminal domain-containing protein n=1 Tax=Diaporthe helianthi TaxID=158607 RepID=A0A2P5I2H6_DIAHE|nr:hypothetical protein DHEL01_v204909 [Diaporthe helianthi]